MGTIYQYMCDKCGYEFETSGPWEFYRDEKGRIKPYGHPVPASREAAERGIYGLYANMYCKKCGKVRKVILVEFKEPCRDTLKLWGGGCEPKEEYKGRKPKCPVCGSTELILEPPRYEEIVCPKCGEGRMIGGSFIIS